MPTVMVVDDLDSVRTMMEKLLRREGFQTVSAASGPAAIQSIQRRRPDVVLLDIAMPEMDGLSVLEFIRQDPHMRGLPVIMLTAQTDPRCVHQARKLGCSDYVIKGSTPWPALMDRIRRHVPSHMN